jgi:hypothetical protein
MGINCPMVP